MRAVKKKTKAAILGLAVNDQDDHTRLTRGKNFVLCGGSEETHSRMQETVIKVNEHLDRKGTRLEDVSVPELRDIFQKAQGD
jgi:hypothetical protein